MKHNQSETYQQFTSELNNNKASQLNPIKIHELDNETSTELSPILQQTMNEKLPSITHTSTKPTEIPTPTCLDAVNMTTPFKIVMTHDVLHQAVGYYNVKIVLKKNIFMKSVKKRCKFKTYQKLITLTQENVPPCHPSTVKPNHQTYLPIIWTSGSWTSATVHTPPSEVYNIVYPRSY